MPVISFKVTEGEVRQVYEMLPGCDIPADRVPHLLEMGILVTTTQYPSAWSPRYIERAVNGERVAKIRFQRMDAGYSNFKLVDDLG